MPCPVTHFAQDENGAVTVDFVVLAAAVVGLGLAVISLVSDGVEEATSDTDRILRKDNIIKTSFKGETTLDGFDFDIDSWLFSAGTSNGSLTHSDGPGSDGEPGYLIFNDVDGGYAYLGMTGSYLGDQTDLMGGSISFDLKQELGIGNSLNSNQRPMVRLTGANGDVMSYVSDFEIDDSQWSTFSADMTEGNWVINGEVASSDQMIDVLENLSESEIRIEQINGLQETIGLDNVRYQEGT